MVNPFIEVINQSLPEPQASLLAGILFGVKAQFPKNLYDALITTGTIHLIALSGQNISILVKIISELTLPLGRKASIWITLLTIGGFVWFVGFEPTLIRAAIMGSLTLISVYFGRKSWSLFSLVLAAGLMLLVNPVWLEDTSFQLSFLASFGIILFGAINPVKVNNITSEIRRELWVSLKTTLAAQIFTLPIIMFKFGRVSIIAPLTNVLVGWVITPIMVMGFALSICGWLWLPLGKLIGFLVWVPLSYVVNMVELTARIPFSAINFK